MREDEELLDLESVFVAHRRLCEMAASILGDRARAEDVVQDAYLKIIATNEVVTVKKPVAYIHRIVRNLAIDRYRRARLESDVFAMAEEGGQVPSASGTPEAISIYCQQLSVVAGALKQLPERTRRVFELYRVRGCTQREIAKMLNVSPTLVNFMIRDALNECRKALDSSS